MENTDEQGPKSRTGEAQCSTAFCDILTKISTDPTQLDSWDCRFSFAPNILAKPPRGGSNRNLASVALKRLAGLNDNPSATPDAKDKRFNKTPCDQGTRLAAAITSKLEAGNFRAAVRLLLLGRRSRANKRRNAASPAGQTFIRPSRPVACLFTNGKSKISTVASSTDDVTKCLRTFPAGSSGGPDGLTAALNRYIEWHCRRQTEDRTDGLRELASCG